MNHLRSIPALAALWIAVLALTLAIMLPGLNGAFFFDDNPNIVENSSIHLQSLSFDTLRGSLAGPSAGPLGRPVSMLSFALTHYFFGLDPLAFKAINLAIHLVNGLLVSWLALLLLRAMPDNRLSEKAGNWLALWVAATWLVHPINIMPVLLAVQRMTLLSGMFTLMALISHLKAMSLPNRSGKYWAWLLAGWLLFWPLSVLSKETGLLFPLYVIAVTLFASTNPVLRQLRKSWVITAAILSMLTIAAAMLFFLGWGWLDSAYAMRPFTLSERLLTESRVLWFYAAQIIVPDHHGFAVYHDDIPISTGIISPLPTLAAVTGWSVVLLGIWHFRHRFPVVCFAAGWFLVGHSLESTFLPLEIAHEYRNYLPSLGLLLGTGYLGATALERIKLDHRSMTTGLVAVIPVLVLALFTWMRADQLGKPLVGTQIEAARHPQSARANYSAAVALIQSGYGDIGDPLGAHSVKYYLQQSVRVDPTFKSGYLALIAWGCASRRKVEQDWVDEFARRLESTPMSPADNDLPANLLKPLLAMKSCLGRVDAIRLFTAGAGNPGAGKQLQARFLEAASDYELLVSRDLRAAKDFMARAVAVLPWDADMARKLNNYKQVLSASGQKE